MLSLKEYVKPLQTKFLIHPSEDCVNEEMTVDLELRSVANDTLREATLVPPTVTVEEQLHHKSTIVPPPRLSAAADNKKLQGDWAARDRSIFTSPSQQQLPGSRPLSRRGSNASEYEPDGDVSSQQHTWANRVEKTPEKKSPIPPQSSAAALEKTSRESSPYRSFLPNGKGGPPVLDPKYGGSRRYSYEPTNTRQGNPARDYKRGVSSPNLMALQGSTGRPKSQGLEYNRPRSGSHNKPPRSQNFHQSASRGSWPTVYPPGLSASASDYHRPQQPVYNRSQSDARGIHPPTKEHSFTSSEPPSHPGGGGEWTEVKRKSIKPKNHPPSTKGKSHPKDRRQKR